MRFTTTENENEAFRFETAKAVSLTEQLNLSHHNNSFQVEFDMLDDCAIIAVYDSDFEICGFVSSDVEGY